MSKTYFYTPSNTEELEDTIEKMMQLGKTHAIASLPIKQLPSTKPFL